MAGRKGRSGRNRLPPYVRVRTAGAPTVDDLAFLLNDLHKLAVKHPEVEDEHPELFFKLYQLIGWLLLPDGFIWHLTYNKDAFRIAMVGHAFDQKEKWTDNKVFKSVSKALKKLDHPAKVGSDHLKKVYTKRETR